MGRATAWKRGLTVTIAAALLALAPAGGPAAEEAGAAPHGGWRFEVTPYLWLSETHGTITVRDRSADMDVGFDDVFDLLGDGDLFAGMGHVEARRDKLALFTDAMGMVVDEETDGTILRDRVDVDVEVDLDLVAVELGAAYRLLERGRFVFEGLAGGRYTYAYTGIEADVAGRQRSQDGSQSFVDPFFGGRGSFRLVEQVTLVFRGDVGGFGVGSELAWTVLGGVRWDMPWTLGAARLAAFLGYKVYDLDYENGAGGSKREIDVQMRGPALGLTFAF